MRVKGFTRVGGAVVNMDPTGYEIIKRAREQQKTEQQLRDEISNLQQMLMNLAKQVEDIKRG